jgi:hypothetical protein
VVQGRPGQRVQNNQVKWSGGVAQGVKSILCKYKALSSNHSPTKKKNKEKYFFLFNVS